MNLTGQFKFAPSSSHLSWFQFEMPLLLFCQIKLNILSTILEWSNNERLLNIVLLARGHISIASPVKTKIILLQSTLGI